MARFSSTIYKLGINPVVDPPENILMKLFEQAGRSKGPIPVCGKVNGAGFTQTLIKYQGAWRLYINSKMLKDSGLSVGETAQIDIAFDPQPRNVPTSPALDVALSKDKKARARFDALSPSRQKEILRYLDSLKSAESIDKNVVRIIKHLRGEKTDAQHALMRRPTNDRSK